MFLNIYEDRTIEEEEIVFSMSSTNLCIKGFCPKHILTSLLPNFTFTTFQFGTSSTSRVKDSQNKSQKPDGMVCRTFCRSHAIGIIAGISAYYLCKSISASFMLALAEILQLADRNLANTNIQNMPAKIDMIRKHHNAYLGTVVALSRSLALSILYVRPLSYKYSKNLVVRLTPLVPLRELVGFLLWSICQCRKGVYEDNEAGVCYE